MASDVDPAVSRRRLRIMLRRLRNRAGLTQGQAAEELGWSSSKVLRIENGKNNVTRTDLKALLDLYGVRDPDEIGRLVELAAAARGKSWAKYRDEISPEYRIYLGFESAASVIRQFEPVLIPGMLQTEQYALSVITALSDDGEADEVIARRVSARVERQGLLHVSNPPQMHFLIDEAAIRRHVGGRAVMLEQLAHLKAVQQLPHVTIQVVPFTAGEHAGMKGPFIVLEFADGDDPLIYLENSRQELLNRDDQESTTAYQERFETLASLATPLQRVTRYLDEVIEAMTIPQPKRSADTDY